VEIGEPKAIFNPKTVALIGASVIGSSGTNVLGCNPVCRAVKYVSGFIAEPGWRWVCTERLSWLSG